jgi:hypothetical protein
MNSRLSRVDLSKRTPPAATGLDWLWVYDTAIDIFDGSIYFYFPDTERRAEMVLLLMQLTSSIREYAITTRDDVQPIWDKLREQQTLLDLVFYITGELFLVTGLSAEELIDPIVKSIHACVPRSDTTSALMYSDSSTLDESFVESLGQASELRDVLQANPWLLMLFILRRSGRMNLVRPITRPKPEVVGDSV